MDNNLIYGGGLAAYLGLMVLIGYLVKNRIKTSEDYLVGGRSFGLFYNSGTLAACFLGGGILIGASGKIYSVGLWDDTYLSGGALILIGGFLMCLFMAGTFYMPKLWRLKFISLGDLFYTRFGRRTGLLSSVLISVNFLFWVAVQILVFGKIVNAILGWDLQMSIILAMAVICTYTMLGGLFAVCFTDIVQVTVTVLGVCALVPYSIAAVGGWEVFTVSYDPELIKMIPGTMDIDPWLAWFAAFAAVGLGGIVSPDLMQRAFSAKSPGIARTSAYVACFITFGVSVLIIICALAGQILVTNGTLTDPYLVGDAAAGLTADPELILPVMSKAILPLPLVVLFLGAGLSAVMSAAATALLALAGMISINIYRDIINPEATEKQQVFVTRTLVLGMGIFATLVALYYPSAAELSAFGFDLILASLLGAMTLGLFWKKANSLGAAAGMITGILFRVVGAAIDSGEFSLIAMAYPEHWYFFTLFSPVISFATIIGVSLATQEKCPPIELQEKLHEPEGVIAAA